jgi:hypothetical protein
MNKGQIILTVTLSLFAASVAWAQDDQNQTPAPSPVPAFGQENPVPSVSENPPISAVDQPGLEPHAAPESFFLPGLHFSESVDSNVANTLGGSSTGTVTRGLGSLTLQRLWRNYDVAMDYIGGVAYYSRTGIGIEQVQQFDLDNRINWKRGQLAIRDSFSYLPEGTFGFSTYGGSGAYNLGMGSLGAGMLGASAFGGSNNAFNGGSSISLGQVPRLSNLGLADIVENLTPKSSVTLAAGYGIVHFYGDLAEKNFIGQNVQVFTPFVGSSEFTAQVGYDRILNAKDQIALSYGYQAFNFSTVNTAFHSNVIQVMYGHRISGRMDFTIGAGPQFTQIDSCSLSDINPNDPKDPCTLNSFGIVVGQLPHTHIGLAGRVSLRYKFPRTNLALSYQRYTTSGSGVFAGSRSDIVHGDVKRPLNRIWDVFSDVGYSKNVRLQLAGSAVNASVFSYVYAGAGVHRQFGRSLRAFVSYQFNDLWFDTPCPLALNSTTTVTCSNRSQRHVGSIGLDWTPRPIRID